MKALIVDDEIVPRMVITEYMQGLGLCASASHGKEAIELYKTWLQKGEPFDLVFLDIQMPEMDGQEVLRQIRQLEDTFKKIEAPRTAIVMVTALGDSENVIKAFGHQCDGYLVKPIKKENFLAKLSELNLIP
jgi:two-component system, chemotaxis family, chemotaxis protein CheY